MERIKAEYLPKHKTECVVVSKPNEESGHLLREAIKDNMEECKRIVEDTISEPTPSIITTMKDDNINHPKYYETGKF